MQAAVFRGGKELIVEDVKIADPAFGQVRVAISHCGICHSDKIIMESGGGRTPVIPGHEAAGVVDAVGEGVRDLKEGDRVILSPIAACGDCYFCTRGQPGACVRKADVFSASFADGSSGLTSARGEHVYRGMGVGGFASQALITEAGAIKVPDDTPLNVACVIGCAVQTGVGAVINTAHVEPGATVLVLGAGGIGLSAIQGARAAGAATILVSDPNDARRKTALGFGATTAIDPTSDDVVKVALELTNGIGVDYAFEASGVGDLQTVAIAATRGGGTTVLVGAPPSSHSLTIPTVLVWAMSEKKLAGCFMGSCNSRRDIPKLLSLWRSGQLDLEALVTARRPLEDINEGLTDLANGVGIRTVITMPAA